MIARVRHLRSTRDAPVSDSPSIPRPFPFFFITPPEADRGTPAGASETGRSELGPGAMAAEEGAAARDMCAPVPRGRHSRPRRGARVPGRRRGRRRGRRVRLLLGVPRRGASRGAEPDRRAPEARGGPRGGRASDRVGFAGPSSRRTTQSHRDGGARRRTATPASDGTTRTRHPRTTPPYASSTSAAAAPPVPRGRRRFERRRPRHDVARRRGLAAQGLRRRRRRARPERQRQDEGAVRGRRRRERTRPAGFAAAPQPPPPARDETAERRHSTGAHGRDTQTRGSNAVRFAVSAWDENGDALDLLDPSGSQRGSRSGSGSARRRRRRPLRAGDRLARVRCVEVRDAEACEAALTLARRAPSKNWTVPARANARTPEDSRAAARGAPRPGRALPPPARVRRDRGAPPTSSPSCTSWT